MDASSAPDSMFGDSYGPEHTDLLRFVESPLDRTIDAFAASYAAATSDGRAAMRQLMSEDDFYALFIFARRSALATLRSRDETAAIRSLQALASVDPTRADRRDVMWAADIAVAAINSCGADARSAIAAAAALSPDPASLERDSDTRWEDALLYVYHLDGSPGLVARSIGRFAPSSDLVAVAVAVGDVFAREDRFARLEVATVLPGAWFDQGHDRPDTYTTGSATVSCGLSFSDQMLTAFVSEFRTSRHARRYERLSNQHDGAEHVNLSVSRERVLCVVIARSTVHGVPGVESSESLARFRPGLAAALQSCD